jgi:hypothetical protein
MDCDDAYCESARMEKRDRMDPRNRYGAVKTRADDWGSRLEGAYRNAFCNRCLFNNDFDCQVFKAGL